jgi:hypothetical protein
VAISATFSLPWFHMVCDLASNGAGCSLRESGPVPSESCRGRYLHGTCRGIMGFVRGDTLCTGNQVSIDGKGFIIVQLNSVFCVVARNDRMATVDWEFGWLPY